MKKLLFCILLVTPLFASNAIAQGCKGKTHQLAESDKQIELFIEQLDTVLLALEKWHDQSQETQQPEAIIYN